MSAQLAVPSGTSANTALPVARNLEQTICVRLLRTPLELIAKVLGCDLSGASRVRSGEKGLTIGAWLKLMNALGYKLVNKTKICMEADEARMKHRAYAFIYSDPLLVERFNAELEVVPLEQDFDA